jgi:hypothetical protein
MKRFFRIFELTKSEQRVVLITIFALIAISFVSYERRVHRVSVPQTSAIEPKLSPTPAKIDDER